jgi:hypothetical protein
MSSFHMTTLAAIASALCLAPTIGRTQPSTDHASSCAEMAQMIRGSGAQPADGDYTLYWQKNAKWSYLAHCRGMTSNAHTYFKLGTPGRAPTSGSPGVNFFQNAPTGSGAKENWWEGTMVMSVYDMVEIDPKTMAVIHTLDDNFGRRSSGKIRDVNAGKNLISVAFGNVGECNDAVPELAHGRIDLTHTNFKVSHKSTLAMGGYRTEGGSIQYLRGNQIVELSSPRGYCGYVAGKVILEPK